MKGRVIAVQPAKPGGLLAALIVDGRVEDLIAEPPGSEREPTTSDIFVAHILRKLPNGAAFCTLHGNAEGYLRDAKGLKANDTLPVQVVSIPEPSKATTVTQRVLLKAPRVILTPGAPGINVSRQIRDPDEIERLKATVSACLENLSFDRPIGVIIRTGAGGAETAAITAELRLLAADWIAACAGMGPEAARRLPADWLLPTPDAIVSAHDMPLKAEQIWRDAAALTTLREEPDPFSAFDVQVAIDALKRPEVPLDGGASMVIEPTRALVAVDVNTGANFSPAAGLKANLAAARDLPRQLRLRGLGGQIAVDFAPMPKQHRRTLEETLKRAFRDDPVETSLVGWTALGLYELQRKRERRPLAEVL